MDGSSFSFSWQKVCPKKKRKQRSLCSIFQAINIGETYQAVVPDLLPPSDSNDQGLRQTQAFLFTRVCRFIEPFNDSLLWSPPLDSNQDENSTLVNKYLKLAAKERRFSFNEKTFLIFFFNRSHSGSRDRP